MSLGGFAPAAGVHNDVLNDVFHAVTGPLIVLSKILRGGSCSCTLQHHEWRRIEPHTGGLRGSFARGPLDEVMP